MREVDELVARTWAATGAPSLVAGVVRGGRLVHVSAAGEPVDTNRQFRLGSITKSLTAALVLRLRDEGRLDLDDPVREHLPGLGAPAVRLRTLLGHAAGLQREPDGPWWERHAGGSVADLVAGVTAAKFAFGPYDRYHYSNLGYGLLGAVIARLRGTSWWDEVSTRLLAPLGMARTTYQSQEPFATGYVVRGSTRRAEPRHDAGAMAPAGQLWSTVDDLARWTAALTGHHPTVLAPSTVDEMARPVVIGDIDTWTDGYGLGLQLRRYGEKVYIGHTGSMPGYLAAVFVHRPSDTGVLAFANCYTLPGTGIGATTAAILTTVLSTMASREPDPREKHPVPTEVEPLLGPWWWMGRAFELSWTGPGLALTGPGEDSLFTRDGPDRWRGRAGEQEGELLTVLRGADGAVVGLDIATFVFRREPLAD